MARYEADKIIQLLEFCSWLGLTEMNHTGLHELASRLTPKSDDDKPSREKPPNEKYLVDLLSDARSALKKDNFVVKKSSYVNLLLNNGGFKTWSEWIELLNSASEYVVNQNLTEANFDELQFNVVLSGLLEKQLQPTLLHVKRCNGFPLNLIVYKEETLSEQAERLLAELKEHSFMIWALPLSWKNQVTSIQAPSWQELMDVGRIIPVWVDPNNFKETTPPFIPGLKQTKVLGGISGVLTTLLFLREKIKEETDSNPESQSTETVARRSSGNVQHFNNSSGVFLQGNIYSKNTSLGDIHQTIHNHKRNKND